MMRKGYPIASGYMGYNPKSDRADDDGYVYYASESDYNDEMAEQGTRKN